jgi:succinate dehydrogenase / fumarate reductase flavoprotein subunit
VADYLEFAELLALDALTREESCGGHFREEYQTPDNEAQRDDQHFAHAEYGPKQMLPEKNEFCLL